MPRVVSMSGEEMSRGHSKGREYGSKDSSVGKNMEESLPQTD